MEPCGVKLTWRKKAKLEIFLKKRLKYDSSDQSLTTGQIPLLLDSFRIKRFRDQILLRLFQGRFDKMKINKCFGFLLDSPSFHRINSRIFPVFPRFLLIWLVSPRIPLIFVGSPVFSSGFPCFVLFPIVCPTSPGWSNSPWFSGFPWFVQIPLDYLISHGMSGFP